MTVSIRLANDDDVKVISDICRVTFEASIGQLSRSKNPLSNFTLKTESSEIYKRMRTGGGVFDIPSLFFLAQLETNSVGVLELSDGHIIDLIFVVPQYQRKGIGTKLFEEMRVYEREKVKAAKFIAAHSPVCSVEFFQSLGFLFEGHGHADFLDSDFGEKIYMRYHHEDR
ncbi:MAG: Acetyltransferase domain [Pseudomonadota bacterium]